jgi:hypothetical protein
VNVGGIVGCVATAGVGAAVGGKNDGAGVDFMHRLRPKFTDKL